MYQANQPAGHAFRPPGQATRPRNPYARSQVPRQQQPVLQTQLRPAAVPYAAPLQPHPQPQQLIPGLGDLPQFRRRAPTYEQRAQNRSRPYERPNHQEVRPRTFTKQSPWQNTNSQPAGPSQPSYSAPRIEQMEVAGATSEQEAQEPTFVCDLCDMKCKSEYIYEQHMKGKIHQKRVKRLELEKLWEKKDPSAFCRICNLALNPSTMEMHLAGAKHKELAENAPEDSFQGGTGEAQSGENSENPQSNQSSLVVNVPCELCSITLTTLADLIRHYNSKPHMKMCVEKYLEEKRLAEANPFYCKICEIALNGQKTYDAHIQGAKHKNKLANAGYDPNAQLYETAAEMEACNSAYSQETYTNVYQMPQGNAYAKPRANTYGKPRTSAYADQSTLPASADTYPSKFIDQSKTQDGIYTSAFARDIPPLYCDICDLSFNGQKPYEDHIQGYRHNYKLTNGNFDPNSAFGQKFLKLKAKLARKRQMEEEMLASAEQSMGGPPGLQ